MFPIYEALNEWPVDRQVSMELIDKQAWAKSKYNSLTYYTGVHSHWNSLTGRSLSEGTSMAGCMTKSTSHAEHASLWFAAKGNYVQNLELVVILSCMSFMLFSKSHPISKGLASGRPLATLDV